MPERKRLFLIDVFPKGMFSANTLSKENPHPILPSDNFFTSPWFYGCEWWHAHSSSKLSVSQLSPTPPRIRWMVTIQKISNWKYILFVWFSNWIFCLASLISKSFQTGDHCFCHNLVALAFGDVALQSGVSSHWNQRIATLVHKATPVLRRFYFCREWFF